MKRVLPFVFLAAMGLGCSQSTTPGVDYGNVSPLIGPIGSIRHSAADPYSPNFCWRDSSGRIDSLTGLHGKVVLLNFWASWCGPCRNEMADIGSIATQLQDSLVVVGVSIDAAGDYMTNVKNYIRSQGLRYQIVVDSDFALFRNYLIDDQSPIPQTFIIDRQGNARYQLPGGQPKDTFLTYIRKVE